MILLQQHPHPQKEGLMGVVQFLFSINWRPSGFKEPQTLYGVVSVATPSSAERGSGGRTMGSSIFAVSGG